MLKAETTLKAMLLRVGMDTGTDGALAPIFHDGSFEYIPLSENYDSAECRTYRNTIGKTGKPLAYYLPAKIWDRKMHFDPEFESYTYGDPTSKRKFLVKLVKGDLLVFYAGLFPYQTTNYSNALYVIGYFTVEDVFDFTVLSEQKMAEICNHCSNSDYRLFNFNHIATILLKLIGNNFEFI